ncbi:MAG TPA: hypothetical protein VF113_13545 [Stellaceae bacterium]
MSAPPDSEAIELLLENVAAEEDARLIFQGEQGATAAGLPQAWIDMLTKPGKPAEFIDRWWAPVRDRLPATIGLLKQKTSSIGLLTTRQSPASLVYCFGTDKSLFANRGFMPVRDYAQAVRGRELPLDLSALYRIHDGWVDFFSSDDGLLPIGKWHVLGGKGGVPPFLEVYLSGSTSMGFDIASRPARAHALLPDEDTVEPVGDVWAWLDEALANNLEDLDDAEND